MNSFFQNLDASLISLASKIGLPVARLSLFAVYFWFGILKILGSSPANPLVNELQQKTLPFISFENFILLFAVYEMLIGLTFLFPRLTRLSVALVIPHLISTSLPLMVLPSVTWQGFLTPTMEGQYIIKNLLILSLTLILAGNLKVRPAQTSA